jgi:hypothetical protein
MNSDNWHIRKDGTPHPAKEVMDNMAAIDQTWWAQEINGWIDEIPIELDDQPELLEDEIETTVAINKLEAAEIEPETIPVAPTVVPPPAPPAPSAWANRNFKEPVRQTQSEPSKIAKWTAGTPSPPGGWEDAARPFLDS